MPRPKGDSERRPFNKSAAIREPSTQSPDASVKEIVSQFSGRGVRVHPNLVYLVKSKMKSRHRRKVQ